MGFGGAGPIPYDSLILYANEKQYTGDMREAFFRIMAALDMVFMEDQQKESIKKHKANSDPKKRVARPNED